MKKAIKKSKTKSRSLTKRAAKTKTSKKLRTIEDAPFFKIKMEKAEKIFSKTKLPEGY